MEASFCSKRRNDQPLQYMPTQVLNWPIKTNNHLSGTNCKINEAIERRLRKPSLNRDNGFELARIYDTIDFEIFI